MTELNCSSTSHSYVAVVVVVVVVIVVVVVVSAVIGDGGALHEAGVIELETTKSSSTLGRCCQGKVNLKSLN